MKKPQDESKPRVGSRGLPSPPGSEMPRKTQVPEIHVSDTSAEDCNHKRRGWSDSQSDHYHRPRSPRPVTVHALFDWYFDSSDESEELENESQSPEDLRKMFHNVLNRRSRSPGGDDISRWATFKLFNVAMAPCSALRPFFPSFVDVGERESHKFSRVRQLTWKKKMATLVITCSLCMKQLCLILEGKY